MSMLINFRDFGDRPTASGARVQAGRLFRSGHLAALDATALERVHALDFAAVVDLRYADEREKDRSPWSPEALDRVIAHAAPTDEDAPHLKIMQAAIAGATPVDDAYAAFYAALPFDRWYRPLFATALHRMAAARGPILVHCTAGKDRTGTLVALTLDLLGVSRDAIVADYMLSMNAPGLSRVRADVHERLARRGVVSIDEARVDELIGVKPAYILAALDSVASRCGSVAAYFAESGVTADTVAALRANFLDPDR